MIPLLLPLVAAQTPAFPDTEMGTAARQLVAALDSESDAEIRRFCRDRLPEAPAREALGVAMKVRRQSRGLIPRAVVPVDERMITVDARSRVGNHWTRLILVGDGGRKGMLREIGFMAIPDADLLAKARLPRAAVAPSEIAARVDRVARELSKHDLFSGTVLVAFDGRIRLLHGYNLADRDHGVPNGPETRFHIASMGKMFTSVAIAQLAHAGKLSLDARLIDVLPEYPNREAAAKISLRQLLSHRAGLGSLFDRLGYDRRKRYARHRDYLPVFASEPLLFEPGAGFSYSNEGYVVLGAVIERISGESYETYLRRHVFAPAGMTLTGPASADDVLTGRAVGYRRAEDDPLAAEPRRPNWTFLQSDAGNAAGGYYSTAADMYRFARALTTGRLLPQAWVRELTRPRVRLMGPALDYGYGFYRRAFGGSAVIGHEGGGPFSGIQSALLFADDGRFAVAVLGNYDPPMAMNLCEDIVGFLAAQRGPGGATSSQVKEKPVPAR